MRAIREIVTALLAACFMFLVLWLPAQIVGLGAPLGAADPGTLWRRALIAGSDWGVRLSPFLLVLAAGERVVAWLLRVRRPPTASNGAWRVEARQAVETSAIACAVLALVIFVIGASLAGEGLGASLALGAAVAAVAFACLAPTVFLARRLTALAG